MRDEPRAAGARPELRSAGGLQAAQDLYGYAYAVAQRLTRVTDHALAARGLTTKQWFLLAVLQRWFPDPLQPPSLSEAAAKYGTSRQNVKKIALQLQARGYLELTPDPHNRGTTRLQRCPRVTELDHGAEQEHAGAVLARVVAGLTPQQQVHLADLLQVWGDHLEQLLQEEAAP